MHGRRTGPLGVPIAFETLCGWVLAGKTDANIPDRNIVSHHVSFNNGDDLLYKFWEIEGYPRVIQSYHQKNGALSQRRSN